MLMSSKLALGLNTTPTSAVLSDSDRNRSEFGQKLFPTIVGIFYFRIRSENSDLQPIDQLNVWRQTLPLTPMTSLDSDRKCQCSIVKLFLVMVKTFYPRIRSKTLISYPIENSDLILIDRLNIPNWHSSILPIWISNIICHYRHKHHISSTNTRYQFWYLKTLHQIDQNHRQYLLLNSKCHAFYSALEKATGMH